MPVVQSGRQMVGLFPPEDLERMRMVVYGSSAVLIDILPNTSHTSSKDSAVSNSSWYFDSI